MSQPKFVVSWCTALGPHVAPGAKSAATRDARDDPEPPNAADASALVPYSPQRHKATTPATIAAIGKPRPASGSLKKNIDAKDLRRFRVTRPFDSRRGASRRVVSTRDGE